MITEEIKKEINRLDLSEKLILVEEIWDSIAPSDYEVSMPEWQKEELSVRYKDYKEGKLGLHDWKFVHKNLRETKINT